MKAASWCLILVLVITGQSLSAVIRVPGDQPTIQAGIKAAVDGDMVLVADGIYTGSGNRNLNFKGKAITVKSENGPASCIIDCEGNGRGFIFNSGETKESVVSGFTIRNGFHLSYGGGIYCSESSPTIENNIITGNRVSQHAVGGGIVCIYSSRSIIKNNLITGNSACLGGGIATVAFSSVTIINNTISGNDAKIGSGIACKDGGVAKVLNTIIWKEEIDVDTTGPQSGIGITYSDVSGDWTGKGNINADPMFTDNYHLQAGSPCIDAGDPNSPLDPDGTRADMGAFYYDHQIILTVLEKVSGDNQSGIVDAKLPEPLVVLAKDQYDNAIPDMQVVFAVTQGNGSVNPTSALTNVSGVASTELTLGQTAGLNEVTVTVNELSITFSAIGQVLNGIIHVDVANISGIENGSQAKPFNTIQEGIDAALNGATVLVADGIYKGAGNVNLDFGGKNIIVKSEHGADNCIINCEYTDNTCGFFFNSGELNTSVVDGFTIQHGSVAYGGGGIYCDNSSPTITNNIIINNSAKFR